MRRGLTTGLPGPPLRFLATLAAVTVTLMGGTGGAAATTGGQPLQDLPIFGLTPAQAGPYLGKFDDNQGRDQLIDVSLVTRFTVSFQGRSVVQGMIVVREYDAAGRPVTWIGTTYEYHVVDGTMHIDIFSPDGDKLLGRLHLRPQDGGALTGSMNVGGKSYRTTFQRIGEEREAPPPVVAHKDREAEAGHAEADGALERFVEKLVASIGW